ncbi:MAG: GDSL-type esterase/lipase family protein [Bacteroidales bacterium]|jgi:lysophospholipase L1-like esterase|nr:GDSL-type esterase/lipase family protein [Bacteroidales bacterium]
MKSYRIVLFIFIVIGILIFVSAFFPKDGLVLGDFSLQFPDVHSMLTRDRQVSEEPTETEMAWADSLARVQLLAQEDTLAYYKNLLTGFPARFYFPEDDLTFFDSLFTEMETAKETGQTIRVMHYGDSQIEMDRITGDLRQKLQEQFGGGGPGMLPLLQTIPTPSILQRVSGNLSDYAVYGTSTRCRDGSYGLMGKFYRIHGDARFSMQASSHRHAKPNAGKFATIKLIFKNSQKDFSATLTDEQHHYSRKYTQTVPELSIMEWQLDTPATQLTLSMHGSADIYAILADDRSGVSVDNIPIRGSSGTFFTQLSISHLSRMYQWVNVKLIILQFGGNSVPYLKTDQSIETFKEQAIKQIKYLQKACPRAKILFIGPSDMSMRHNGQMKTYPHLPKVIDALKEAALDNGAAYWDIYSVMGGENSMVSWVNKGFAGNDYVHFTTEGASKVGDILSSSFLGMYDFFKLRKDMNISLNSL